MQAERRSAPPDAIAAWDRVSSTLRVRIGEQDFTSWIAPLRCSTAGGGTGPRGPRPSDAGLDRAASPRGDRGDPRGRARAAMPRRPPACRAPRRHRLRATSPTGDHTFETFVVGESNAHAVTEARRLVSGATPRLLFLHGPSGVGKTHLLHATYHALVAGDVAGRSACPPRSSWVASSARTARRPRSLLAGPRPVDALLLDDVHSLVGQQAVQTRLIEGLARLAGHGAGAGPHLRSGARGPSRARREDSRPLRRGRRRLRRSPRSPRSGSRSFRSRLGRSASSSTRASPRASPSRSAATCAGSRASLTRLVAHARLLGRKVDEALALEVLPDLRPRLPAALTVDRILDETAAAFGGLARALRGRSRRPTWLLARQVAMYLARKLLKPAVRTARGGLRP